MGANIHILIDEEVKKFLEKNKKYPRESNNEILRRLLKIDMIKDEKKKKMP